MLDLLSLSRLHAGLSLTGHLWPYRSVAHVFMGIRESGPLKESGPGGLDKCGEASMS